MSANCEFTSSYKLCSHVRRGSLRLSRISVACRHARAMRGPAGTRPPGRRTLPLSLCQQVNDEIRDQLPVRPPHPRRQEIAAEDRAERMQVGHVKKAQGAHQHVHVDRAARWSGNVLRVRPRSGSRAIVSMMVALTSRILRDLARCLRVVDVLDGDQAHEVGVGVVVVERELGQTPDRLFGREQLEVQRRLVRRGCCAYSCSSTAM